VYGGGAALIELGILAMRVLVVFFVIIMVIQVQDLSCYICMMTHVLSC
jgi:hypothetical protein